MSHTVVRFVPKIRRRNTPVKVSKVITRAPNGNFLVQSHISGESFTNNTSLSSEVTSRQKDRRANRQTNRQTASKTARN